MARILQTPVPALFSNGWPSTIIYGEAPGPRGADKSGIPFLGDVCGKILYQTLAHLDFVQFSNADVEELYYDNWKGEKLKELYELYPFELKNLAISNAYPRCPTDNGETFRAPTWQEILAEDNAQRIHGEIRRLTAVPKILALGRSAEYALQQLGYKPIYVPHPSPCNLARYGTNGKSFWRKAISDALLC